MPSHRAVFNTAEEARTAASAAVARLTAQWTAAASSAGDQTGSPAPTVAVRIEGTTPSPVIPTNDRSIVGVRITAPDGRNELAAIQIAADEAELFLSKSSGTALFEGYFLGYPSPQIRVRARIAKSIQVTAALSGSPPTPVNLTTAHFVQDRFSGKFYTCVATTLSTSGVHTVLVTETDATDTGSVTHGTVLEFIAPPPEVNPIARVNALKGFTFGTGLRLEDALGRVYETVISPLVSDSSPSLSGDLYSDLFIGRVRDDGIADDTPLAVGDKLTLVTPPSTLWPDVEVVSAVNAADATMARGDVLTAVTIVDGAPVTHTYAVAADTPFGDYLTAEVPFVAIDRGPEHDRKVGDIITHVGTVVDGTVESARGATSFPEPYASQVVGSAMTWSSHVHRGADGRWICDVFTLPHGS